MICITVLWWALAVLYLEGYIYYIAVKGSRLLGHKGRLCQLFSVAPSVGEVRQCSDAIQGWKEIVIQEGLGGL